MDESTPAGQALQALGPALPTDHGLAQVWLQGDVVTRTVFALLLAMSVFSWIVILIKTLDALRMRRQARKVQSFWHAPELRQGLDRLRPLSGNPFRELALHGQEAAAHHRAACNNGQLHCSLDASDWIARALHGSLDDTRARLQGGLTLLASVGSTAPFVGLFGTVWGIYHALMTISSVGQASIGQVAGPIGEALIMTAMGLAAAIPAVLGHNALVRSNRNVLVRLNRFGTDLLALYLTGSRVGAPHEQDNVVLLKSGS